jgi:hypothetical protein
MMPVEVLEVFALYWLATIGFIAWAVKANVGLERKLNKEGE